MRQSSLLMAAALAGTMLVLPASAQQPGTPATPLATPPATSAAPPAAVLAPAADAKVIVVGSVVQLRSGGPKLTVSELSANTVTAIWFLEATGFKKETFPTASIKLVEDNSQDKDDDNDDDEDEDDE